MKFCLAVFVSLFSLISAQDPKPSDKSFAATLHIFQGRKGSAVLISRGKLPDVVGAEGFTLVEDLSAVPQGAAGFSLNGQNWGSSGGGHVGEKTFIYQVAEGSLTVDFEDCEGFTFDSLSYDPKSNNALKLFGMIADGTHIVLPNMKDDQKVGDLVGGKATIDDAGAAGLDDLFDKVPDGTACTVSWMNGNDKKQTLKLVIGKNLRTVNTIIAICIAVMAAATAVAAFYMIQQAKK